MLTRFQAMKLKHSKADDDSQKLSFCEIAPVSRPSRQKALTTKSQSKRKSDPVVIIYEKRVTRSQKALLDKVVAPKRVQKYSLPKKPQQVNSKSKRIFKPEKRVTRSQAMGKSVKLGFVLSE